MPRTSERFEGSPGAKAPKLGKNAVLGKTEAGTERPESPVALENTGACLEPAAVSDEYVDETTKQEWAQLGLGAPGSVAAMFVKPSTHPSWMISLHRRANGAHFVRVARTGTDAEPKERPIDGQTARLFETLWKSLVRDARVPAANSIITPIHGPRFRLWHDGKSGIIPSPTYGSILERATFAVEWLAKMVEQPSPSDADDLKYLRAELSDALGRVKKGEPCTKPRK